MPRLKGTGATKPSSSSAQSPDERSARKRALSGANETNNNVQVEREASPTKKRRGRPPGSGKKNTQTNQQPKGAYDAYEVPSDSNELVVEESGEDTTESQESPSRRNRGPIGVSGSARKIRTAPVLGIPIRGGRTGRESPEIESTQEEDEQRNLVDTPAKRQLFSATKRDSATKTPKDIFEVEVSDPEATVKAVKTVKTATTGPASGTPGPRARFQDSTNVTRTPSRKATTAVGETPRWRRNDRSAKKKSARALIERVVGGENSDDDDDEFGDLAREIFESSEEEDPDDEPDPAQPTVNEETQTPSKRGRGRPPKKAKDKAKPKKSRKKSESPPRNLPPHELYFSQNRPGPVKTSNNTLASLDLLTHDEYFSILQAYRDPHEQALGSLESSHAEFFPQWSFELSQGFNICLYGYGSKRSLLHKFATHIHNQNQDHSQDQDHKIVIVNGYVSTTSLRAILHPIAQAIDPSTPSRPLPAGSPAVLLDHIRSLLSSHPSARITIILHSIDAPPLRKPGIQPALSQLSNHPRIHLVASADTPDFALLWDSGQRSAYNFAFHDATSFLPFGAAEGDVVDEVHELLGRRARRVGGKEGVGFVLRSLPENARRLFGLLVGEVLVAMDVGGGGGDGAGEDQAVEYRMLYAKAVEEFICSSEVAFRTLLKEFHDHQMIASRKDALGTELLSVPFRKEELEAILEDLMS